MQHELFLWSFLYDKADLISASSTVDFHDGLEVENLGKEKILYSDLTLFFDLRRSAPRTTKFKETFLTRISILSEKSTVSFIFQNQPFTVGDWINE